MIGKASACTLALPHRWIYSLWGTTDIHLRQKWAIIWPLLKQLPHDNITLLDVGCGPGIWSNEIGVRRPQWKIVGIDLDGSALRHAEQVRDKIGLTNVQFIETDYLDYRATEKFDSVLSISSAHHAFECGRGPEMFQRFHEWLKPRSRLILYAPRRGIENPFIRWRRGHRWYNMFTAEQLSDLCAEHGLVPEHLSPRIGPLGSFAKELHRNPSALKRALYYTMTLTLSGIDHHLAGTLHSHSLYWLMVVRKPRHLPPPRNDRLGEFSSSTDGRILAVAEQAD